MRWEKFANFAAHNLGLSACLHWHVAPPALRGMGHDPQFQSWVEQQVDFIAVRPYESLDMMSTDTKDEDTSSVYVVWFHIEGEERPCSRLRHLDSNGPSTTIQSSIDGLVAWHSEYWALQPNRPLVIDAIVRHTTKRHPDVEYYRESVEFFLVPADAQPRT